jgi:acyl-coenzyme A synthetase/AMP-(fatty) acid ligase
MSSLGFDLADRHVVDGRGEHPAYGELTFAKLTERAAELGGGLRMLGVMAGDPLHIALPSGEGLVIAVCALARLGAVPSDVGVKLIDVDGVPRVLTASDDLELAMVQRAGRSDPAAALREDVLGYPEMIRAAFGDIVEALMTGSPVV